MRRLLLVGLLACLVWLFGAVFCGVSVFGQDLVGVVREVGSGAGVAATVRVGNVTVGADSSGRFRVGRFTLPVRVRVSALNYMELDTMVGFWPGVLVLDVLPRSLSLSEVTVSTGYQKVSKERLTGSFQSIGSAALGEQVGRDLLGRLESLGSGLMVDRESAGGGLKIRGSSTIGGPGAPLIVLDNFPYEGDLGNINPNEVERVTVLKDAAASSIWGTRAGNGVIVITTKKAGVRQPLKVNATSFLQWVPAPDLGVLPWLNSSEYIDAELFLFRSGRYLADFNSTRRVPLTPVVETMYNSSLSETQKMALIDSWRGVDVRSDLASAFYGTGRSQQYFLQASAGGERYGWVASAGYDNGVDNLAAGNRRLNLRYALNLRPVSGLEVSLGMQYADVLAESGKPGYADIKPTTIALYPYADLVDGSGGALPLARDYRLSYLAGLDGRLLDWKYYPLTDYLSNVTVSKSNDLNLNTGISYTWKGLKASVLYRFQRQQSSGELLNGLGGYTARNLVNSFSQLASGGVTYRVPLGDILNRNVGLLLANDVRGQLNYNRTFGAHAVDVLAGAEARELRNSSSASRLYGYSADFLTSVNVDYVGQYPNLVTGGNSFIPTGISNLATNRRFVGVYANAGYTYLGRFLAYGSVRRDASNLYGVATNDKWKPLWSAGLGWIVSKESFWKLDWMDLLKLRATYGFSGNVDPSKVAVTTISLGGSSPYTASPFGTIAQQGNPDLRWETVRTINLAADFSLWKGRLSGSLDFYWKRGTDLFGAFPVDYTTGIGASVVRNVASMRGRGFDLSLASQNVKGVLSWDTQLNLSWNNDRVSEYYVSLNNASGYVAGTNAGISGLVDYPLYSMFSFASAGLDAQGNPLGYLNGALSTNYQSLTTTGTRVEDLKFHGSAVPTQYGNLVNRLRYRGFHLEVAASFKLGYYFRRETVNYSSFIGSGSAHSDFSLRWKQAGDELSTVVPAFTYPANSARDTFFSGSQFLVDRGDHVRLQYVNLGFELPDGWLAGKAKLEVFGNMANLGVLWRANGTGLDPEYAGGLLPSKTISFGAKLNF